MGALTKHTFLIKVGLAALLAVAADRLFWGHAAGSDLGLFDLTLAATLLAVRPSARRDRRACCALLASSVLALLQIEQPTPLNTLLCWMSLAIAALSSRVRAGETVARWAIRLAWFGGAGLIGPARDLVTLAAKVSSRRPRRMPLVALLALPLVGGGMFMALFASANPVIGQALATFPLALPDVPRAVFLGFAAAAVWALLRPRFVRSRGPGEVKPARSPPGVTVSSIGLCLVTFNLIFAVENGLDLAFLWTGARLPSGVTFAGYAHSGAYALMVAALLAGAFVVLALRPGTATAASTSLRRLVILWVGQTLLLVASGVFRMVSYIQAYSLTGFRIAALIWMGLVAVGLILICWRLLRGRTDDWLIGANALVAGLVLVVCGGVDLDAAAASWNVGHARETGGTGAPLDLCYLSRIGDSALVAMTDLQRQPLPQGLRDRVTWARSEALEALSRRQADWRGWTWRGQWRLDQARSRGPDARVTGVDGPAYDLCGAPASD